MTKVATPGLKTCEAVSEFLKLPLTRNVKSVMFMSGADENAQDTFCMVLVRADHSVNEVKAIKLAHLKNARVATPEEIAAHLGTDPGYCGPVAAGGSFPNPVIVVADRTVAAMSDFVCGANESGYHLTGVNWGRDLPEPTVVADVRNVLAGDPSPDGQGTLELCRGIEVGHVFALGTVYSEQMGARVLDEQGQSQVVEMGCYGIGVTRVVAAAIEQHHDEKGIIWPMPMAPFAVAIAPIGFGRNAQVKEAALALHDALTAAGIEVFLDDRDERPGVMFADLELIGIPHRVTIGDRGLKEGKVEYQPRGSDAAATNVPHDQIVDFLSKRVVE